MERLKPGITYHIFNHANGFENVFREEENYRYFLEKYRFYISPVAETYAYCLMPNHFHLVIRIRRREIIEKLISNSDKTKNLPDFNFSKVQNFGKADKTGEIEKYVSKQFANLFSCYTQSYNKSYSRKGSLFIKNFKREQIDNKVQFCRTVIYTHRNPVHHGFTNRMEEWPYSSYNITINSEPDFTETEKLLAVFGGIEKFRQLHEKSLEILTPGIFEIP